MSKKSLTDGSGTSISRTTIETISIKSIATPSKYFNVELQQVIKNDLLDSAEGFLTLDGLLADDIAGGTKI